MIDERDSEPDEPATCTAWSRHIRSTGDDTELVNWLTSSSLSSGGIAGDTGWSGSPYASDDIPF